MKSPATRKNSKTLLVVPVLVLTWFATIAAGACRGSSATIHAKCEMNIIFQAGCDKVKDEITSRLTGESGWKDPHNGGTYRLESLDSSNNILQGLHLSGNGNYTDLFEFVFHDSKAENDNNNDGHGDRRCVVEACSESQVTSVLDFSTNYCNLRNLYCSKEKNCQVLENDLQYNENYKSCRQRDEKKCSSTGTSS